MGLFYSTTRPITYGTSDAATCEEIKQKLRSAILAGIDTAFNYNHKALDEDGGILLYIDVKTRISVDDVFCELTDANHPTLMAFYRTVITDYVTVYNESEEQYVSHRLSRNYRISLGHVWPPSNGVLRFYLRITYTPSTTSVAPRVLTPHVARLLAQALPAGSTCPITYEPYTELSQLCVGFCGHVFSSAVIDQDTCPLCRLQTGWTTVQREALA